MKIEAGKQYVRLDGEISGVIEENQIGDTELLPFVDKTSGCAYCSSGSYFASTPSGWDIAREATQTEIEAGRGLPEPHRNALPNPQIITMTIKGAKSARLEGNTLYIEMA